MHENRVSLGIWSSSRSIRFDHLASINLTVSLLIEHMAERSTFEFLLIYSWLLSAHALGLVCIVDVFFIRSIEVSSLGGTWVIDSCWVEVAWLWGRQLVEMRDLHQVWTLSCESWLLTWMCVFSGCCCLDWMTQLSLPCRVLYTWPDLRVWHWITFCVVQSTHSVWLAMLAHTQTTSTLVSFMFWVY